MRVLQIHTRYRARGGEDAVVEAEAEMLRAAGHEVRAFMLANAESGAAAAAQALQAPWNMSADRALGRLLSEWTPDVAHVHNTWMAMSPAVVRRLEKAGVPVVMTVHNYRLACINGVVTRGGEACTDCVGRSPVRGVARRCYRNSVLASAAAAVTLSAHRAAHTWDAVDAFVVPSAAAARLLQPVCPSGRVTVKPHFVADPGPRPAPPSQSRTVLFVGRLSSEKGVDVLLDAWSTADRGDLELLVVGDGPAGDQYRDRRVPGVHFAGGLPGESVRREMLRARGLVFASTWPEPFGMVLIEALSAGLPVLASDVGAVREVVGGDGAGWVVAPRDADALARAIAAARDDEAVDRAGAIARARYEARFTPQRNLTQLEQIYRRVMDDTSVRA